MQILPRSLVLPSILSRPVISWRMLWVTWITNIPWLILSRSRSSNLFCQDLDPVQVYALLIDHANVSDPMMNPVKVSDPLIWILPSSLIFLFGFCEVLVKKSMACARVSDFLIWILSRLFVSTSGMSRYDISCDLRPTIFSQFFSLRVVVLAIQTNEC